MAKNRSGSKSIWLVAIIGLFVIGLWFGVIRSSLQKGNEVQSTPAGQTGDTRVDNALIPTPTPFPFQELTIPYLRSREYLSKLGALTRLSENSSYTTYLTSYDSDGLQVNGLLTIPEGNSPGGGWPAIVFVHGYIPPETYNTTVNYAYYVDYLAKNGFVVFKIDLRGHGDSEGDPGGGYYSGDYVIDTLNAYAALQNADFVDPERIGLWGHSMAGNVVFRSFVAKKTIPGIVIWAGAGYTYTDLQAYQIADNSYRAPSPDSTVAKKRQELRDAYGSFDPNHWFWEQVPATNYLEGVEGSVQLDHAVDDGVVSINYSRNLVEVLDDSEVYYELKEYASGGHNLVGSSFTEAMQATVAFFNKHL